MIFGAKAIADFIQRDPSLARNVLFRGNKLNGVFDENESHLLRLVSQFPTTSISYLSLESELFASLDVAGTHYPILVVQKPELPEIDLRLPPDGLEILCALGDPSNVGALLRSAAAFSAKKIVLLKECASPFHPKAIRAASATTLLVPLAQGPSIRDLNNFNSANEETSIVALDMSGLPMDQFSWPTSVRILVGEEGLGVPKDLHTQRISIPIHSEVESLNAVIATSLALYSYRLSNPS